MRVFLLGVCAVAVAFGGFIAIVADSVATQVLFSFDSALVIMLGLHVLDRPGGRR